MFVTFLEFIHMYHTDAQFAQPFCNTTEKCSHYYDHEAFDDFLTLKQAVMARQQFHSLTQERTKWKGQKFYHGTQPQKHVKDQTHTFSTKGFHSELEFLLLGTLGPSFTESTIQAFFPLHCHSLNKLPFSKHSWSLLLFPAASPLWPSIWGSCNPFLK